MTRRTVLVTGATSSTGWETVKLLTARGDFVRALVDGKDRRAEQLQAFGAEIVFGDFLHVSGIREAMEGTRRAYFCFPIRPGIVPATANFIRAARDAGIDGIVNMSQISARPDSPSHAAQSCWLAEQVFISSGIPTAHLRPTFSAEWLLYLAPMIRRGLICGPWSTGRHAPICAYDQARVIVNILDDPMAHWGKVYPLFGPVEYNYSEMALVLSRVLGREIRYKHIDFDCYWNAVKSGRLRRSGQNTGAPLCGGSEQIRDSQSDSFLAQHLRQIITVDHKSGLCSGTNDYVQRIGGEPPTTLEQFIKKNQKVFS
jgi:NAD(P)H dehydrogenase (quinone)